MATRTTFQERRMITRKGGWTVLHVWRLHVYWDRGVIPFSWDWR